jgi:hypothetical protein
MPHLTPKITGVGSPTNLRPRLQTMSYVDPKDYPLVLLACGSCRADEAQPLIGTTPVLCLATQKVWAPSDYVEGAWVSRKPKKGQTVFVTSIDVAFRYDGLKWQTGWAS